MRLVGLLIVLVIIGLLTARQLTGPSDPYPAELTGSGEQQPPRVPQRMEDVPAFERDMQRYTEDMQAEQRRRLEEAMQ